MPLPSPASVRLDKWLWAARFFKTRGLAQTAIENGRVHVNQERVKVAYGLKVGDALHLKQGDVSRALQVLALSEHRGSATVAQALYAETSESVLKREAQLQLKRFASEPARTIEEGRPTKKDRRRLEDLNKGY
jgi:ribosome-associated heat shock protein Hsp15